MELDIEDFPALEEYLRRNRHVSPGEMVAFQRLSGGISNKTVRVAWQDGPVWILKQALAKLRVSADWFSSPERIRVEANGLRWLNRLAPAGATPAFLWEDSDNHLMAMESVPAGHENWKSLLLAGQIKPELFAQFGILLGTIHRRSSEALIDVRVVFEATIYFESLRLQPYYVYTADAILAAAPFFRALVQETRQHKLSLVHGDFSPKNTLIYQGRLIILDYEVVHFGDPAFDAGFALAHFLSKAHHLRSNRVRLANSTAVFWQSYASEISSVPWADALEARVVRQALGCLLARVAGKSPLEYLTKTELLRQGKVVLSMMNAPPNSVRTLIDEFIGKIGDYADN